MIRTSARKRLSRLSYIPAKIVKLILLLRAACLPKPNMVKRRKIRLYLILIGKNISINLRKFGFASFAYPTIASLRAMFLPNKRTLALLSKKQNLKMKCMRKVTKKYLSFVWTLAEAWIKALKEKLVSNQSKRLS